MSAWVYRGENTYSCATDAWGNANQIRCPKCRVIVKNNNRWNMAKKQMETRETEYVNVMAECPACKDSVRLEVWYNGEFEKAKTTPYHVKKAMQEATKPAPMPMPADQTWNMAGSRVGVVHTVKVERGKWSCTCQDHRIRKHDCKHIKNKKATVHMWATAPRP